MPDHTAALTRVLGGSSERILGHISEAKTSYLQLLSDLHDDGEYEFIWDEVCAFESSILHSELAISAIRLICPANLDLLSDSKKLAEKLTAAASGAHAAASSWAEKRPEYAGKGIWSAFSVIKSLAEAGSLAEATYRFLASLPQAETENA